MVAVAGGERLTLYVSVEPDAVSGTPLLLKLLGLAPLTVMFVDVVKPCGADVVTVATSVLPVLAAFDERVIDVIETGVPPPMVAVYVPAAGVVG